MRVFRAGRLALVLALGVVLLSAPSAMADTINYEVEASAAYDVEGNGQGVVKVTYKNCVTEDVRTVLGFTVVTEVDRDSEATWELIGEGGESPRAVFDPSTISLRAGAEQRTGVRLSFTLEEPTNNETVFRFKLNPEEGEGQGQGAGVMVRVPCVVARQAMQSPSQAGAQQAPCIVVVSRTGRRAGQRHVIRVRATRDGQRVQGATVRLRGPGVRASRRTGARGEARFRVTPTRAGTIFVQSDICEGADRLRVLAARRSAGRVRFTG